MKEKIAWVMDSSGHLDEELRDNPDVYEVPTIITIDGKEYRDGIDLTTEELFAMMRDEKVIPKTSQPSLGSFYELYKQLQREYDRVVSFHISSLLSGTFSTSSQAAKMVSVPINIFDSKILSYPMTLLMKKAMNLVDSGLSVKEAFRKVTQIRDRSETYVLVGNLEQLHRSGRLSSAKYILGSMLKLKPIISIENGSLQTKAKVRNERKAGQLILSYLEAAYKKGLVKECSLLYGESISQAEAWRESIKASCPNLKLYICPLGTALGAHAGGETLGISWFNEE